MKHILLAVKDDRLSFVTRDYANAGGSNYYELTITFAGDDWRKCLENDGGVAVGFPDIDGSFLTIETDAASMSGRLVVPAQYIKRPGTLVIGIFGKYLIEVGPAVTITTNLIALRINPSITDSDAEYVPLTEYYKHEWEVWVENWFETLELNHASTKNTFGLGTGSLYGHVKLSDSTSGTQAASSGGTAATPLAVKNATHIGSSSQVMLEGLGGLPAGTDIRNKSVVELLQQLLIKYVPPTVTLTATANGGGIYEAGTTVSPTFTVQTTKKSQNITSLELCNNGSHIESNLSVVASGGTQTNIKPTVPLNANASITAKVGDGKESVVSNSVTYTFVNPFYWGSVASAPANSAAVKAMTKLLQAKGTKTLTYTITADKGKPCIAYPASYGRIAMVRDQNGFDNTGDFSYSTVSVTNAGNAAVNYYVYTYKNNITPGTIGMTFNF